MAPGKQKVTKYRCLGFALVVYSAVCAVGLNRSYKAVDVSAQLSSLALFSNSEHLPQFDHGGVSSTTTEEQQALSELRTLVKLTKDGAIHGNPMANPVCQNALLDVHRLDPSALVEKFHRGYRDREGDKPRNLPPSFWSREALAAMQAPAGNQHLRLIGYVKSNWDIYQENLLPSNSVRASYIHLEKCGSTSNGAIFKELAGLRNETLHEVEHYENTGIGITQANHVSIHGDCTFTFVRDPLHRLVSAYITANMKMGVCEGCESTEKFAFWNATSEPERFRSFLADLFSRSHEFTRLYPLHHASTMTGALSPWIGSTIHFIGKVEQHSEHWRLLSRDDHCGEFASNIDETAFAETKEMSYGFVWKTFRTGEEREVLGIERQGWKSYNKLLLPQYKEIMRDQKLFNDIIEHYWQDYVCFGFDINYPELGRNYTGDFQMPY